MTRPSSKTSEPGGWRGLLRCLPQPRRCGPRPAVVAAHDAANQGAGMIVRTGVSELRMIGRATQGVRIIALKEDDKLTAVPRVVTDDSNQGDLTLPPPAPAQGELRLPTPAGEEEEKEAEDASAEPDAGSAEDSPEKAGPESEEDDASKL